MTVRYEQFPNDATLVMTFIIHHEWGWTVEEISSSTADTPDRVRAILDDPDLREKYELLKQLRDRNAKRMAECSIHVETVIWEPSSGR